MKTIEITPTIESRAKEIANEMVGRGFNQIMADSELTGNVHQYLSCF